MTTAFHLQDRLPFFPEDATVLTDNCAFTADDERVVFFNAAGPILSFRQSDKTGRRAAAAMLAELHGISPTALGKALGFDQSSIHRLRNAYREGGVDALREKERVRTPYAFDPAKRRKAQRLLDDGVNNAEVARQVGICEGTIRNALKKGWLRPRPEEETSSENLSRPSERSAIDASCTGGVAVKRTEERLLASLGKINEAKPRFKAAEAVPNAGVLIALVDVLDQGLVDVGDEVYGSLRNGFFGLRSIFLCLAFMVLLRLKNPEQLSKESPGDLGLLLGLDRAPEVKTLRRKLQEIGGRGLASTFAGKLSQRWADADPDPLGFLYVDGHVRPYNGRKHKLPKGFVQRRRLCMPATTDMWVNDSKADPLFCVTTPANDGLISMLNSRILPKVRKLVGKDRRVTVTFDREGWSPDNFRKWSTEDGFDILTYRKGSYDPWPEACFHEVPVTVCGKEKIYRLGQRSYPLKKGFWVREVRRLCDDGHQTSVITTRQDLAIEDVALRMFARWSQENFFRYMRHEFALDHLVTNTVERADEERMVPNPELKKKRKLLAQAKKKLVKLQAKLGNKVVENDESKRRTVRGFKIANSKTSKQVQRQQDHYNLLKAEISVLPERVPLKEIQDEKTIVKLEEERKVFTDAIKMLAYRTETSLVNLLGMIYSRSEDEGRSFLQKVFRTPGDLIPDEEAGVLTVRLHSMANPRSNRALKTLCGILNGQGVVYPGTKLKLVFDTR